MTIRIYHFFCDDHPFHTQRYLIKKTRLGISRLGHLEKSRRTRGHHTRISKVKINQKDTKQIPQIDQTNNPQHGLVNLFPGAWTRLSKFIWRGRTGRRPRGGRRPAGARGRANLSFMLVSEARPLCDGRAPAAPRLAPRPALPNKFTNPCPGSRQ